MKKQSKISKNRVSQNRVCGLTTGQTASVVWKGFKSNSLLSAALKAQVNPSVLTEALSAVFIVQNFAGDFSRALSMIKSDREFNGFFSNNPKDDSKNVTQKSMKMDEEKFSVRIIYQEKTLNEKKDLVTLIN